jgi:hypothetical protein
MKVANGSYWDQRFEKSRFIDVETGSKELGRFRQAALRRSDLALEYLARYIHVLAISNARLLKPHEDRITFRCKDYAATIVRKRWPRI